MINYVYPPQSVSVAVPPIEYRLNGANTTVSRDTTTASNSRPLPVIQLDAAGAVASALTDTQLRASAVPVSVAGVSTLIEQQTQSTRLGDIVEVAPATDTASSGLNGRLQRIAQRLTTLIALLPASLGQKLMAGSLAVTVASDQSAIPVSGPLTDAQLRAAAVPVSGPLTDVQLRAAAVPVSGPLTDVQLRAAAVPVSGPLTDAQLRAAAVPVSGPLTDAQLRASAVPVSEPTRAASFQEILNLTTTAQTITAPANAKWCKIMNTTPSLGETIRVKIGGVATATSGMRLEPGRSEDFNVAGNISVIAEAGSNQCVSVIFGV